MAESLVVAGFEMVTYMRVAELRAPRPAIDLRIDAAIPFVPATVWLYVPGYAGCLLLTAWVLRDRRAFRAALGMYVLLASVALPFFAWWPIRAPRPPPPDLDGATGDLVRWLFAFDPAYNTFPSLHVANVVLCACLAMATDRRVGACVVVLASGVAVSTLTLKQHWAVDVPAGALLGLAGFAAWRRLAAPPTP